MIHKKIIHDILTDIVHISKKKPNERLPKEEQIRSRAYATLLPLYDTVCVERNYLPVEEKSHLECDIWTHSEDIESWYEIKRCWSGATSDGWMNKPKEQLQSWQNDIIKLSSLDINTVRLFILIGLFEVDPLSKDTKAKVINNIHEFYKEKLIDSHSTPIIWRNSEMKYTGAWIWKWDRGVKI